LHELWLRFGPDRGEHEGRLAWILGMQPEGTRERRRFAEQDIAPSRRCRSTQSTIPRSTDRQILRAL
jgi:hypothetical protein